MLYNDFAVYLGIVYSYLPFMILPLYANLERLDLDLLDAAADLGARRWQAFLDVTLPLSVPGIIGGCLLVFIPGRRRVHDPGAARRRRHADDRPRAVGRVLHQPRLAGRLGRVGRAAAAADRADHLVPARRRAASRRRRDEAPLARCSLGIVAFGYAFLYVPIISVVIYSFNDSRLVTLWGGFSLRWYASLLAGRGVARGRALSACASRS